MPMTVISSTAFKSGVIHSVYAPDLNPPVGDYDDAKQQLPES